MRHTPWKEATWSLFLLFDQTSHGGATILSRWRACWPRCSPSCCALMAKEAAMQSSIEILTMCESEPSTTPAHLTCAHNISPILSRMLLLPLRRDSQHISCNPRARSPGNLRGCSRSPAGRCTSRRDHALCGRGHALIENTCARGCHRPFARRRPRGTTCRCATALDLTDRALPWWIGTPFTYRFAQSPPLYPICRHAAEHPSALLTRSFRLPGAD